VNPEQAYLCGLLHDIGRFVLFDREIDQLNMVESTHWQTPVQLVESERELCFFFFSVNHTCFTNAI